LKERVSALSFFKALPLARFEVALPWKTDVPKMTGGRQINIHRDVDRYVDKFVGKIANPRNNDVFCQIARELSKHNTLIISVG
jgi:hypothetical protein